MSVIVSIGPSTEPAGDEPEQPEQNEPVDLPGDGAARSAPPSFAHRWKTGYLDDRARLSNAVTIGVALVAVAAIVACDWWLGSLLFAGAERSDAWLKAHADVSLGQIALSILTLLVAGLTVAGVLDPRRRNAADMRKH